MAELLRTRVWWLLLFGAAVIGCIGDAVTTLWALRVGLTDYNPLYTNNATAPWLLLVTHALVLAVLAVLVRWRRDVAWVSAAVASVAYGLGDLHNLLVILPHLR